MACTNYNKCCKKFRIRFDRYRLKPLFIFKSNARSRASKVHSISAIRLSYIIHSMTSHNTDVNLCPIWKKNSPYSLNRDSAFSESNVRYLYKNPAFVYYGQHFFRC